MTIWASMCTHCGVLGGHEPNCPADDGQPTVEIIDADAEDSE